jgi:transcriptional regulator with XRE-family HTH domain
MNDVKSEIALRMRAAREQAGLSQGQVAKLIGCQRPTISEIEAGRRKVSADELKNFSTIYNVSISWLTGNNIDEDDIEVEIAARELSKLKKDDFDKVFNLIKTLSNDKGH